MVPLTLEALDDDRANFDALAHRTPETDGFCSSSKWVIPAAQSMMPPRSPYIFRGEEGYIALMRGFHPSVGNYLQPLEATWSFANGLIGDHPKTLIHSFARRCREDRSIWDMLRLSGVKEGGIHYHALIKEFALGYRLLKGHDTHRHHADLSQGLDAYLGRRSSNFRRSLRKSQGKARRLGIQFQLISPSEAKTVDGLYGRLLAIEDWSWKGLRGSGLVSFPMRQFYALILPRLVESGSLRLGLAKHEGRDIGYILGAKVGDTYRGLQFSFDDAYRALGMGNLLQLFQMSQLVNEGISTYDLGSDSPYKDRWSDDTFDTTTFIIRQ